jgi:hypothetical protein
VGLGRKLIDSFKIPVRGRLSDKQYITRRLIPAIEEFLTTADKNAVEEDLDLLVVMPSLICEFSPFYDYSIPTYRRWTAIGSGSDYAIGAATALGPYPLSKVSHNINRIFEVVEGILVDVKGRSETYEISDRGVSTYHENKKAI